MLSYNLIWSIILGLGAVFSIFIIGELLVLGSYSVAISPLEALYANSFGNCGLSWCFISVICLLMLIVCGRLSLSFSHHYTGGGIRGSYLSLLMFIFLCVMMLLVTSCGLLTSLLMWEYLGLVSFVLILYYGNSVSLKAALITMITSRVGDVAFFLYLCLWMQTGQLSLILSGALLLLIVGTKSASYPFMPWLLEAMRAPTPVSALVHSSTLVAAGVWFSCNYLHFLTANSVFIDFSLLFCIVTVLFTGVCALVFIDLKKLIALSTSNNISWCLIFLLLGDTTLCLAQLLSHGVAKCILFILAGDLMSTTNGTQSYYNIYQKKSSVFIVSIFLACLGLSGIPFLGVFFTKHLFMVSSISSVFNLVLVVLIFIGQVVTCAYTARIVIMCLGNSISSTEGFINIICLSALLLPLSSLLNINICSSYAEQSVLTGYTSIILYFCQISGFLLGYLAHYAQLVSYWFSGLFGLEAFNSTWRLLLDYLLSFVVTVFFQWDILLLKWCIPGGSLLISKFGMQLTLFIMGVILVIYTVVSCVSIF